MRFSRRLCETIDLMSDHDQMPEALREVLEAFAESPADRNAMLIEYSDQFRGVPERIATRPFPLSNQVPHCESDTYVFVEPMEASADPKEESVQITLELIDKVKTLSGVRGIHFMAVGWESIVPRLIKDSGLR